jgi:lipopolysaccharide transport system ATP-binding protein
MNDDIVIKVDGLWKRYGLPLAPVARGFVKRLRKSRESMLDDSGPWALRDVSFEVKRGETLGIIGRNGAGKSTLLKILAGVTPPTRGHKEVRGRVFPMIELNAGIHPELTGRENVRLLGAIMGLSRQEVEAKIPEIEEFTELGGWFDQPVRKYSSGMLARLGFGVAMYVHSDILLIDEVLAVGDLSFQKKCINRMAQLGGSGVTMLFVSHNPYMIERICERVLFLHVGEMQELGNPTDVIHKYFEIGVKEERVTPISEGQLPHHRPGSGDLRIQKVEILNGKDQTRTEVSTGGPMTIRLYYKATEPLWEPNFGIRIFDPQNTMVVSFESTLARKGFELYGEGYVDCRVQRLPLMPNIYTVQVKVAGDILFDILENATAFRVRSKGDVVIKSGNKGIAYAEADWQYRHKK